MEGGRQERRRQGGTESCNIALLHQISELFVHMHTHTEGGSERGGRRGGEGGGRGRGKKEICSGTALLWSQAEITRCSDFRCYNVHKHGIWVVYI